ncbi:hypothetical protein XNC1_3178 [Xenorhabdus nematophila ATCC 19061]|uniref:Uncharacterized protein n=1 Tax=Xenorhabdus nematophila (strain ATCC 19061 / DSM 3370 / CCUG 14189 / LMG 1036 / NCIMB 9965 / AN6) TaxID=406817 RepID=D3VKX2_XENNA|nr:hypothetical protein XNC1_3178 [Xenorhabdus nematophila ATCC 19061]CEK24051.1 hypothetical protein XNC2_3057 [Xenorhabdus nematophila AN6/1]
MKLKGSLIQNDYLYYTENNKIFLLPESISVSDLKLTEKK